MTTETARTIAGLLAQQLGVKPDELEGSLTDNPLAAVVALSFLSPAHHGTCDPAATVRFAATLVGACPICLGEDIACYECSGKGGPGSRDPDAAALVAWITPALGRVGLCIGRPRREHPERNHGGRYSS
jgi:hypothetical protein